jgi:hypothetical protein
MRETTVVKCIFIPVLTWNHISRIWRVQRSHSIRVDVRFHLHQFFLADDPQSLDAIGLSSFHEILQFLHILVVIGQYQRPVGLIAKSEFLVQLRKHLISLPAILGPVRVWRVIVARVHDSRIALGGPLRHIIGRFEPQDGKLVLGQFSGNGRSDATSSDNDDIVRSVRFDGGIPRFAARTWGRTRRAGIFWQVGEFASAVFNVEPISSVIDSFHSVLREFAFGGGHAQFCTV